MYTFYSLKQREWYDSQILYKAREDEIDEWTFHEVNSKADNFLLCPTRLELLVRAVLVTKTLVTAVKLVKQGGPWTEVALTSQQPM